MATKIFCKYKWKSGKRDCSNEDSNVVVIVDDDGSTQRSRKNEEKTPEFSWKSHFAQKLHYTVFYIAFELNKKIIQENRKTRTETKRKRKILSILPSL